MENQKDHIFTEEEIKDDLRYLQLLAQSYPNVAEASCEIINLEAILNLPKPTEHFISDPHGESEAFNHVLRNASGYVKRKVEEIFGPTLRLSEKQELCTLIYYPEAKLQRIKAEETNMEDFYVITLNQLIKVLREVSSKYTRSKIRKELPAEFGYIIEELLHESHSGVGEKRHQYYNVIVQTIIDTQRADHFIVSICNLIQRLAIDRLHLLGDIFDRGPGAHLIMETLMNYHHFDIVWGNHDIEWFGAAAGNRACIANVLRLSMRYGNLTTLEDGYGINLLPLATFAMETYKDDPCKQFGTTELTKESQHDKKTTRLIAQMHKAITIIALKLEGQLYKSHPHWQMQERDLLSAIDYDKGTVRLEGKNHALLDTHFPTIDPADPCKLTPDEENLIERLRHSFEMSLRLRQHIRCLLHRGSMYGIYNGNLLFHASVPLSADGSLKPVNIEGESVSGRALMDRVDYLVRLAFDERADKTERQRGRDFIWYLWCGKDSPLFDKSKMATFERYFIADKATHHEEKGFYYKLRDNARVCDHILSDFGISDPHRHIINGHVPVHVSRGENPIKADGRLMVIDGGFAAAYHETTGIAGYTLVYHSRGFQLVQHEPFASRAEAVEKGTDIRSTTQIVEMTGQRQMVADTDKGEDLRAQIADLRQLLDAYRKGLLKN